MSLVRVLVVDDFDGWRKFILSVLHRERGFEIVGEATDGLKAIQLAEKLRPCVVVLDISLPGINGVEACRWIGKVTPDTRIVCFSEYCDEEIVRGALNAGAMAYVAKSDAASELVAAIQAVARGERYLSRRVSELQTAD